MHSQQYRTSSTLISRPEWLFILAPFAHWFGAAFMAAYVLGLFAVAFFDQVLCERVEFRPLGLFALSLAVGYFLVSFARLEGSFVQILEFHSLSFSMFAMQATQLFLIVFLVSLFANWTEAGVQWLIRYLFWLSILTIVGEAVATNAFGIPSHYFPAFRDVYSYIAAPGDYQRPFGLTGSAPVNGSILVMLLWMQLGLRMFTRKQTFILHGCTLLALALNQSGQALLAYVAAWVFYLFQPTVRHFVYVCMSLLLGHLLLTYGAWFHYKLSYDYLWNVLQYVHAGEVWNLLSAGDLLWGAMVNSKALDDVPIEVFPIHAWARFGIVHSLLFWGLILYPVFFRGMTKAMKVALLSVLMGSLHYGSVQILVMQVPLAVLLVTWSAIVGRGRFGGAREPSLLQDSPTKSVMI